MQLRFLLPVGLMFAVLLTNCAGYRTVAERPEPRPLGNNLKTYQAPQQVSVQDAKQTGLETQDGDLTLKQALTLALLNNPDLAVFSWEVRAREARALQASLLPNPEFGVEIENLAGTGDFSGFDGTETTIQLSQLIELAGKRRKRTAVAALESDLAAWDFEIKRLDVLTQVTQSFVSVISAQERVTLNTELVRVAQRFVNIVAQRVQAGATSPAEESRARVALANARIQLDRTQRELEAARKRLAATWGSKAPAFQQARGQLDTSLKILEYDQLLSLLSQNPEIARWAVEMQRRHAVLSLAKAQSIPDPRIGGGLRRLNESDDNAFVVGLSIPIPIFNRNQGVTEAARMRINQGEWARQATELRISTLIAESYQGLSTAFNEATTLQSSVLPEAQKAFDTINAGYKLGKFGFLEVLDAQRTLFDSRSQYLLSLTEYQKAKADLERLIGQSLDTIQ